MNFNSPGFLVFFPAVLVCHRLLPPKRRWMLLLAASYFFYMGWNPWLIFLLLGTTAVSFFSAREMARAQSVLKRRFLLAATLSVCLGSLVAFKYLAFFLNSVLSLLHRSGSPAGGAALHPVLPVGISFYTFQTLSYVIDVYRGRIAPEPRFGCYALYIAFFPQLVAGPIERPENLLPQLRAARTPGPADLYGGFRLALSGYVKKVVIADTLAGFADRVYAAPDTANGLSVAVGTALFALQIYCDFSGYSEIAMGTARMMGIRLMRNFDRPYSAASIRDFWRRWHISLTTWFTDYLYIPLGGSRKGELRHYFNILAVFLLSGLWHGASWTFVIWGGLHGFFRIAEHFAEKHAGLSENGFLHRMLTHILVCFAWIFFRARSVGEAFVLISRLFTPWSLGAVIQLTDGMPRLLLVPLCIALLVVLDRAPEQTGPLTEKQALTCFYLILSVAAAWFALLNSGAESAFIYFQF